MCFFYSCKKIIIINSCEKIKAKNKGGLLCWAGVEKEGHWNLLVSDWGRPTIWLREEASGDGKTLHSHTDFLQISSLSRTQVAMDPFHYLQFSICFLLFFPSQIFGFHHTWAGQRPEVPEPLRSSWWVGVILVISRGTTGRLVWGVVLVRFGSVIKRTSP